jgi:hypothetical protein
MNISTDKHSATGRQKSYDMGCAEMLAENDPFITDDLSPFIFYVIIKLIDGNSMI